MRMPNAEQAVVDMAKLTEYCLSPDHPRGKHKARVFAAALGLTAENAQELRDALLMAADSEDAALGDVDEYGQRYVLDFAMKGPAERRSFGAPGLSAPMRISRDWSAVMSWYE